MLCTTAPMGSAELLRKSTISLAAFAFALNQSELGLSADDAVFDTVLVNLADGNMSVDDVVAAAEKKGMNIRVVDTQHVAVSFDETHQANDLKTLLQLFGVKHTQGELRKMLKLLPSSPALEARKRTVPLLEHPIFNSHHSETEVTPFCCCSVSIFVLDASLPSLSGRQGPCFKHSNDPTGILHDETECYQVSTVVYAGLCVCFMKGVKSVLVCLCASASRFLLNFSSLGFSEMEPVLWPQFANLHPFAPAHQAKGTLSMIESLSKQLCLITGFAAMSHQPNSGANGEYAGLMCIKEYHQSRGDHHRNICLIPISAHGTNPASAVMAGMKVVIVNSDSDGNIDIDDLVRKVYHSCNHCE